jgi:hypothetical protein
MKTGSWVPGLRASTTFPFWSQIASTTGRSGGVLTTIPDWVNWGRSSELFETGDIWLEPEVMGCRSRI